MPDAGRPGHREDRRCRRVSRQEEQALGPVEAWGDGLRVVEIARHQLGGLRLRRSLRCPDERAYVRAAVDQRSDDFAAHVARRPGHEEGHLRSGHGGPLAGCCLGYPVAHRTSLGRRSESIKTEFRIAAITFASRCQSLVSPVDARAERGEQAVSDAISPFEIAVPEAEVDALRRRLHETRWPDREVVPDWSQGAPLEDVQELVRYWRDDYDWRATERRLNGIPQFRTTIDELPIHFAHLRSARPEAVPIILTHGWPGSFLEFERAAHRLVEPSDGAPPGHVVIPSLPGYAFSGRPTGAGWNIHRIADAWCELMARLGYDRFLAAGSDWGTSISTSIALQRPERLLGLHLVPPLVPVRREPADLTAAERRALTDLAERSRTGSGYSAIHATRPQTLGYALTDSPV